MEKVTFVKEFQWSRRIQRSYIRASNETDEEYNKRIKIAQYGLEGEDRVHYQLSLLSLPLICLSDIRIEEEWGTAQADFLIISKERVFIIEVKNLFGSIRIENDGQVVRLIPRKTGVEEEGMQNPFNQVRRQANVFEKWFMKQGYYCEVDILIVMANPRTIIYQDDTNFTFPMVRYDFIDLYLKNKVSRDCDLKTYENMKSIGTLLANQHRDRFFHNFEANRKLFFAHSSDNDVNISPEDRLLYEEILECRRKISKRIKIPPCNIFLNREAEMLVRQKPTNKEEFMRVPGFKEKKYLLCGEEIIAIINKYIK